MEISALTIRSFEGERVDDRVFSGKTVDYREFSEKTVKFPRNWPWEKKFQGVCQEELSARIDGNFLERSRIFRKNCWGYSQLTIGNFLRLLSELLWEKGLAVGNFWDK